MKKTITLLSGLLLGLSVTFAQTFAFFHNGVQLENNAEITVSELTSEYPNGPLVIIEAHLDLYNLTNSSVETTCNQIILDGNKGGTTSFCFISCFARSLANETQDGEVNSGKHEGFHINYKLPDFGEGGAKVQYEVYPTNNPENKQVVIVNFDPTAVNLKDAYSNDTFNVYQSGNGVTFDYNLNVTGNLDLYIYNATGMVVGQYPLTANQGSLTLPESLNRGVYIAAIKKGNNSVSLQKFMVR